jgi:ABC-type transport system substrate-binding protein
MNRVFTHFQTAKRDLISRALFVVGRLVLTCALASTLVLVPAQSATLTIPGAMNITIQPPEAVADGAQWSVDAGPSHPSGAVLTNLAPVAKALMEKGGFKVDMQSMDWQTLVARRAKKDPPAQGGWHAFLTSWVAADILNPVMAGFLNASCDKAMFGWPCDKDMEGLRDQFARESNPAKQKAIAEAVQARLTQYPTHVHLGQWYQSSAMQKSVTGSIEAPVPVFWNVEKK